LYNELPLYNANRRGTISVATLRNLQQSRSNPQLFRGIFAEAGLPLPDGTGPAPVGLVAASHVRSSVMDVFSDR